MDKKTEAARNRIVLSGVILFVSSLILGGFFKTAKTQPGTTLYMLGIILLLLGPIVFAFGLIDDEFVSAWAKSRRFRRELLLVVVLGVAELLYFYVEHGNDSGRLLSIEGMTTFLTMIGLWVFLLVRVFRKIRNFHDEGT